MPGRMLVNTGEVSLALDTQVVLRWRCLFPRFSRLSGLPWQAASNRNRQDQSRDTECEPLRMRPRRGVARRVPASFCHTRESEWGKVAYPRAFDLRIVIASVSEAIHGAASQGRRWIASLTLAMTAQARTHLRIPATRIAPE